MTGVNDCSSELVALDATGAGVSTEPVVGVVEEETSMSDVAAEAVEVDSGTGVLADCGRGEWKLCRDMGIVGGVFG